MLNPDDVLRWEGGNGVLNKNQEYLVNQVREGARGQEFTLKHRDGQVMEPVRWWMAGSPFVKRQKAVRK